MAASDGVKLLGLWPSPYVNRVQIVLNLKSIKYELLEQPINSKSELLPEQPIISKSELLLKSNPVHKKVPVLIHGDKPLCESLIIVEYIDEVWSTGPRILPSDPFERANARFWAVYVDDKLFLTLKDLLSAQGEEAKSAVVERMIEELVMLEDAFGQCSKGKDFFGGDCIGFVDIAFGSVLGWLKVMEEMNKVKLLDETKMPGLVGWAHRFCSHDAAKDVIPETEKLMEYAKMVQARRAKAQSAK